MLRLTKVVILEKLVCMSTIFTQILSRKVDGYILWEDSKCFAFLDIRPINRGHTLVVPIEEIDLWTDLPEETISHCMKVAKIIGEAQMKAFKPKPYWFNDCWIRSATCAFTRNPNKRYESP